MLQYYLEIAIHIPSHLESLGATLLTCSIKLPIKKRNKIKQKNNFNLDRCIKKYSDYTSLTQVSNKIHNLWLYKLKLRKCFNLHQCLTHNIQVKLIGLKQI